MQKNMCPICSIPINKIKYQGNIRNGRYPNVVGDAIVYECTNCEIQFLSQYKIDYTSSEYRELVDSGHSADAYYSLHDNDQYDKLAFIDLRELRNKKIVDIGCGAGSFLDLVKGLVSESFAIEPALYYHDTLINKGHIVKKSTEELLPEFENMFDYAVSFSVIEHVDDPLEFMKQAVMLLKKDGTLIFSTPNSGDILLKLLPQEYSSFFYRVVHKWYFNEKALAFIAQEVGLKSIKIVHKHRFDISNLVNWMNEKKPNGTRNIEFSEGLNRAYKCELEENKIADYIYLIAKK